MYGQLRLQSPFAMALLWLHPAPHTFDSVVVRGENRDSKQRGSFQSTRILSTRRRAVELRVSLIKVLVAAVRVHSAAFMTRARVLLGLR